MPHSPIHTADAILEKLDSDLSDAHRTSFLAALLNSEETLNLLSKATVKWDKKLQAQEMEMTALKALIQTRLDTIEIIKEHNNPADNAKITALQQMIGNDNAELKKTTSSHEKSIGHLEKTKESLKPMMNASQDHFFKKFGL